MFTRGTEMAFPAYLMKGERIEFDGEIYVIPEPVACRSLKDLVIFLYDRGVRPLREHSPFAGRRRASAPVRRAFFNREVSLKISNRQKRP